MRARMNFKKMFVLFQFCTRSCCNRSCFSSVVYCIKGLKTGVGVGETWGEGGGTKRSVGSRPFCSSFVWSLVYITTFFFFFHSLLSSVNHLSSGAKFMRRGCSINDRLLTYIVGTLNPPFCVTDNTILIPYSLFS